MSWRETSDFSLKNLEKFFPACSVGADKIKIVDCVSSHVIIIL